MAEGEGKHPVVLLVGGPTASGKTALAITVAERLGVPVLSADSRQFYREMRIGNARPTAAELERVRHYFIADRSLSEPLNAGTFAAEALNVLDRVFRHHRTAVVVGGSGLYLRALRTGLDDFPAVSNAATARVATLAREEGLAGLQRELARLDPEYFARVDRQNGRRLERALRICYTAGRPYSSFLGRRQPRPFTCLAVQPEIDRSRLYDRINRRVDHMLAEGLEAEARALWPLRQSPVLQTVGYQEWWPYFEGSESLPRTVELIKRNSRRYAKRQITWFKDYRPVADAESVFRLLDAHREQTN